MKFNPPAFYKSILVIMLFAFTVSSAQCTYDITNLGGSDLVDWNGHFISNVTIAGDNTSVINNTNTNTRYTDYTAQSVNVTAGNTYNFSITNDNNQGINWGDLQIRIWIDYNNDGNYTQVFSNNFGQNNNVIHTATGSFTIATAATAGVSKLRIQAAYCSTCGGNGGALSSDGCSFVNTYRGDVEDYTLNISQPSTTPIVSDDNLDVIINSGAGANNQVDVSANDSIGPIGGDGDDYSINMPPVNGAVTEISDGVFQYIPNTDFIGTDSFTYTLCDSSNQCETGTVNINVGFDVCVPTSNSNGTHFITNVNLPGDTTTINNTSGNDGGYGDYTGTPSADLIRGSTYPIELSVSNQMASENRSGWSVYIDLDQNGTFEATERVWDTFNVNPIGNGEDQSLSNTDNTFNPGSITIPATASLGKTVMRIGARRFFHSNIPCGNMNGQPEEFEDYVVDIKNETTTQDIDVSGNGNNIVSGSTVIDPENFTSFNIYDINSGAFTRTYIITNSGVLDLTLVSPFVTLSGSPTFTVSSQPGSNTLMPGESTTFSIAFDPDSIATFSTTVSISSDDPDENPFTFLIEGEGAQTFPDTDGDGVPDNVDVDDDNDGLTDLYESTTCASYPNASTTDLVFLNETFGAGTNRIQINTTNAGVTTTYCFEDGSGSCPAPYNSTSVNDGDYAVHHTITNNNNNTEGIDVDISQWAEDFWYAGEDHTPGDTNGRMAIFNATEDPGVFYSQGIGGVTPNIPIQFGFFAINIDRIDAPNLAGREKPEVIIRIFDPNGIELASETSGLIAATSPAGDWVEVSASFTSPFTQFTVELSNASPGGEGSDLAIDDIFVKQTLCDLDGDGVADVIDLDNDNDGIPNVVELGLIDDNHDATVFNDSTNPWVDANGNGLHDSYEGLVPLDSDGDGVPNHLDLDSDNDGIFDNVEYNGLGDIDVNGDGIGTGSDFQDTLVDNTSDDQDGDGILSSIDDNDDDIDNPFDLDHGTFDYPDPLDTDGDLIPDYLDTDSNDASNNPLDGTDISDTIYVGLDADNDGVIDGNTDADQDGLLDAFDTDDLYYGSPRDLDASYSLFFDGRNDYVEDDNVLSSGSATIMAWIKSEGNNTLNTNRIVAGQNNFYLVVNNSNNSVTVMLNGVAVLTSTDTVIDFIWTHVAATTSGSETVLYINGEAQGSPLGSGSVNSDSSNFTIGRLADTDSNYFHGEIDEVRVFNSSLTEEEIQRTVYQELEENESFNQGKIIPKDISTNAIGSNLVRYYKMDGFKDDITDNKVTPTIDENTGAKLYNIKDIFFQTAPLPYRTIQDGLWTSVSNWEYGDVWDIDVVANNKDWSIVELNNNISTTSSHTNLGLIVKDNQTFTVNSDNYINNNWYLELNGTLDLIDESQLIQTNQSDLVTDNNGNILRRQEGLANVYRYNYWGSPVGQTQAIPISDNNVVSNASNTVFNLNMLKDSALLPIEFTTSHDEIGKLSTFWTYIFQNGVTYFDWVNIGQSTALASGVGYIHKGTGVGATDFQYVFDGKPNNGTIVIPAIDTGGPGSVEAVSKTEYLVGNPYPSALDAHQFINDNAAVIGGDIYLWEQWAGDTHILELYEGGYATLNLMTSVKAYQFVGLNGANNGSQDGTLIPTQFLPVAQGFMVEVLNTGDIEFNNGQRVFKTEASGDSVFFRNANQTETAQSTASETDLIKMIRLELNDTTTLERELVLGFSNITTDGYDYGYDSKAYTVNTTDLYLPLLNEKMVIQGYADITPDKVVDLTFIAASTGQYTIKATAFDNIEASQEVYLLDNLTGIFHDLTSNQDYSFTSNAGTFENRFDIVFENDNSLSNDEFEALSQSTIYYSINQQMLYVKDLKEDVKQLNVYNTLGQVVFTKQNISPTLFANGIPINNLSTGLYIVSLKTENNQTLDKKIIIE